MSNKWLHGEQDIAYVAYEQAQKIIEEKDRRDKKV